MARIKCLGCGKEIYYEGQDKLICPYCNSEIDEVQTLLDRNVLDRLSLAAGFRRVGRFDDAQRELENILDIAPDLTEVIFALVLNYYEVTEYAFNRDGSVALCKCYSTDKRPIEENKDWKEIKAYAVGANKTKWVALCNVIENLRQRNRRIRDSIPDYRAILLYDYSNEKDKAVADGLYKILSKKTDIFFPPETLKYVPYSEREEYLMQILHTPDKAPLLFIVFSDAFSFRKKSEDYYHNIARQCEEFADFHTKNEMISVTCDYEPPSMIRRLSIKTVFCEDFEEESFGNIAKEMYDYIAEIAFTDDEYVAYKKHGEIAMKNNKFSPIIVPLEK